MFNNLSEQQYLIVYIYFMESTKQKLLMEVNVIISVARSFLNDVWYIVPVLLYILCKCGERYWLSFIMIKLELSNK